MLKSKYFRAGMWILLIFFIILVGREISFIFTPIVVLIQTIFFPILIAGILYYLLSPLVDFLCQHKVKKTLAIIIVYLLSGGVLTLIFVLIGPIFYKQLASLTKEVPVFISRISDLLVEIQNSKLFMQFQQVESFSPEKIAENLSNFINNIVNSTAENITSFINFITNFVMVILIVPFLLFYMLKDGEKLPGIITSYVPRQHSKEALSILSDMNKTLGQYIQGQILVSLCVGVLLFIGFLIIGLDYALVLALIAFFTNFVPFIGPIIGTIPALLLAVTDSPAMVIKTLLVVIVVQQTESLFISPKIMGTKLSIHPIMIIFIILFAGRLAGILGIILAVPAYAILKVIAIHLYKLLKLRRLINS